jgi:hypothetical protein
VQATVAATLDLGKPNKIEQRRAKWTTFYNVNIWFESLKEFLISEGFALLKGDEASTKENYNYTNEATEENHNYTNDGEDIGEILYREGQDENITNLDESAIVLDNTDAMAGGRPAMSFCDPNLQGAPSEAAFKNSYRATGMFGCTMSGRVIPVHFVLPTDAQVENQGIHGASFIEHMKSVIFDVQFEPGVYDKSAKIYLPSWGMNEKGSMTM